MPSWPSRLLPPPHNQDQLSVPEQPPSRPSTSRSHGRSQSHYIPSGNSNPPGAHLEPGRHYISRANEGDMLGSLERDGGHTAHSGNNRRHSTVPTDMVSGMAGNGGNLQTNFTTGRCSCCDSYVRWPTHLSVFRCTTCTTINDLAPAEQCTKGVIHQGKGSIPPISAERTRSIINSCIRGFLEQREWLDNMPEHPPPPPPIPIPGRPSDESGGLGGPVQTPPVFSKFSPNTAAAMMAFPAHRDLADAAPSRRPSLPILSLSESFSSTATPPPRDRRSMYVPAGKGSLSPGSNGADRPETGSRQNPESTPHEELVRKSFRPLENYLTTTFGSCDCLNASFLKRRSEGLEPKSQDIRSTSPRRSKSPAKSSKEIDIPPTSVRSPGIDWESVDELYDMVINVGADYRDENTDSRSWDSELRKDMEDARAHIGRSLLKATESVLKRPGRPLKKPEDVRFLLIILANPLLYPESSRPVSKVHGMSSSSDLRQASTSSNRSGNSGGPGHHSGIIKRIMGLVGNLDNSIHHYLVSWFTRMPEVQFRRLVELVGSFITYRLTRQPARKKTQQATGMMGRGVKQLPYNDDWQIKAAAKVMALFFSANNNTAGRRGMVQNIKDDEENMNSAVMARREARRRGQIILTSEFYNMLLDYHDLIADFDVWESRSSKFCFCQYSFLLSMGSKIQILEHDAKRQMEVQARQAFFNSISTRRAVNQYLVLKVRRECLVEDSLRGISEGAGGIDDIKKGLRIEFIGEDGVDAGGLKKEWFLMVARDVFDPNYGMFIYDEDSKYCYFNPYSLESSEEYYLVGMLLGLAIYNSTILDVALPPYVFKKLLHLTNKHQLATSSVRPPLVQTLEDLAVFRPALASGLVKLLEFEGDVEATFCRDFVAESERYGEVIVAPLCPGGENKPVTNANRKEFVDLYLRWILDTSVARQFEPFKRGFYTVCGGNALSLFRPEEIELLIRGSDEALDVSAMKAVAIYDGWGNATPADNDPVVRWFWSFFERISPKEQRMLLHFITGSDRIPAMGATSLIIKVGCLGQDCNRFPVARTCFNQICLWRYKRREKLESMLWRAVTESEGFGLK
ncbi:HECT-domain-containing protein [Morchella conica CCBAS932]|uniref:HECT-type E3 ubiquitin transferase n=1 Tax=Morchella conica CCBAS932 TaxID=1392247 RepID=A0A3N4KFP7_9PEZI|nr:HECT-domain-containing protein [Morchella conica CCBAS932]